MSEWVEAGNYCPTKASSEQPGSGKTAKRHQEASVPSGLTLLWLPVSDRIPQRVGLSPAVWGGAPVKPGSPPQGQGARPACGLSCSTLSCPALSCPARNWAACLLLPFLASFPTCCLSPGHEGGPGCCLHTGAEGDDSPEWPIRSCSAAQKLPFPPSLILSNVSHRVPEDSQALGTAGTEPQL